MWYPASDPPPSIKQASHYQIVTGMGKAEQEKWRARCDGRKRPSIHMPRWACRITLEVVSVRVERLQEIGVEDTIAEGIRTTLREHDAVVHLREQFAGLWNSINGDKDGRSWDDNPWVWVVEFTRKGCADG